jgi:hypothetical protein
VLPVASVDIAIACTALHWLPESPCYMSGLGIFEDNEREKEARLIWSKAAKEVRYSYMSWGSE